MMSLRLLSSLRNVSVYLKQASLQAHTSVILLNSKDSSSSSSSDSSDSDSDKEDHKIKKLAGKTSLEGLKDAEEILKSSDTNERLNILLQKINEASQKTKPIVPSNEKEINIEGLPSHIRKVKPTDAIPKLSKQPKIKTRKFQAESGKEVHPTNEKSINVAIKPKNIRFNQVSKEEKLKQKPHEHQIKQAAKAVAESLGGDAHKIELELLSKALNLKQESPDAVSSSEEKNSLNLSGLLTKMKVDTLGPNDKVDIKSDRFQRPKYQSREPSVAESVLYKKSITRPKRYEEAPVDELNVAHPSMGILTKISDKNKDEMQLSTWDAMEIREMRLSTLTVPQNAFQELIQWTNEGKIWHFPIDNEQGMEDEKDVHFSEHVFMDRHLKDWCPRQGPIRHFMELVCTGLSKNPYMTVEEKVGHIKWYRDYFEDKKELLHELGVLDNKASPVSPTDKKEIEA